MKVKREDLESWIEAINDGAKKPLTSWEKNFMASVTDQFDRSGFLSDSQIDIVERIYAEKT